MNGFGGRAGTGLNGIASVGLQRRSVLTFLGLRILGLPPRELADLDGVLLVRR